MLGGKTGADCTITAAHHADTAGILMTAGITDADALREKARRAGLLGLQFQQALDGLLGILFDIKFQ